MFKLLLQNAAGHKLRGVMILNRDLACFGGKCTSRNYSRPPVFTLSNSYAAVLHNVERE